MAYPAANPGIYRTLTARSGARVRATLTTNLDGRRHDEALPVLRDAVVGELLHIDSLAARADFVAAEQGARPPGRARRMRASTAPSWPSGPTCSNTLLRRLGFSDGVHACHRDVAKRQPL